MSLSVWKKKQGSELIPRGWFRQSKRHSLAARGIKTGRSHRKTVTISKNVTNKQWLEGDFDKDGVKNKDDCYPLDPDRQDFKGVQEQEDQQMVQEFLENNPHYREAAHKMDFLMREKRKSGFGENEFIEFEVVPKGVDVPKKTYSYTDEYGKKVTVVDTSSKKVDFGKKKGLEDIPQKEGLVYRGMSHQEYENAKKKGYFKSREKYNLGYQEGLTFGSKDPETAQVYASGFAPIHKTPTPEHKGKVVAFKENKNWLGPGEASDKGRDFIITGQERAHEGPIPFSQVEEVYELEPERFQTGSIEIVKDRMHEHPREGSRRSPSMYGKWKKIYKRQK